MNAPLASPSKVKLRVGDFDLLAEHGGLADLERTELLDGDIHLMAPQYAPHLDAKALFHEALLDWTRAERPDLMVRTEGSVAMPPHDEPMPDVILFRRVRRQKGIPVGSVLLLVEVADDSRDRDLDYKAGLYARQGVPEYWVVDLKGRAVVRHVGPTESGYSRVDAVPFGEALRAGSLADLAVDTRELME